MQKAFEDAAFGLEVGEMAGWSIGSGVHIILRWSNITFRARGDVNATRSITDMFEM